MLPIGARELIADADQSLRQEAETEMTAATLESSVSRLPTSRRLLVIVDDNYSSRCDPHRLSRERRVQARRLRQRTHDRSSDSPRRAARRDFA
jgi:hypothetical protein